jgi:hypothetical protein
MTSDEASKMLSPAATASALSISERTIRRWISDGAPYDRLGNGRLLLDPEAVLAWRDKRQNKEIDKRLLEQKLRKTTVDADKAEISLAESQGRLVSADDAKALEYRRILKVREGLIAMEHTLPPRLFGLEEAEMRVIVRRETRRLLEDYARGRGVEEEEVDVE